MYIKKITVIFSSAKIFDPVKTYWIFVCVTLSMIGAPVAKALTPTVGTVKPSAKLA